MVFLFSGKERCLTGASLELDGVADAFAIAAAAAAAAFDTPPPLDPLSDGDRVISENVGKK